jgi:Zn-dependent protease with chaperone function
MTDGARTLEGFYFDGRRPLAAAATLVLGGTDAVLVAESSSGRHPLCELKVSPRTGGADRFIAFPDGGQLQCADHPLLDELPQASPTEGIVAWLEQRLAIALGCIAGVMALVLGAYLYGLPAAARVVAAHIPLETERAVGSDALQWLDRRWFQPSQLPADRTRPIEEGFQRLKAGLPYEPHYRLEFRDAPRIGENAFALPGGTIILTDQMVRRAVTDEEAISILAHEIGHIELRHTMRHVLQDSAIAVLVAAVTSDAASLGVAVAGMPVLLAQARYSRDFEAEADEFAFALLKRRGYSPDAFASLMERLSRDSRRSERTFAFVSTHPISEQRIQRAREAAR